MLKIGNKTRAPQEEVNSAPKEGKKGWFKNNQRSIIAVTLIALMAFVLRFAFAYGVSADSGFALSGGSSASEHLSTITALVSGGSIFGADGSLNYPFSTANPNPILIDLFVALFAMIGKACGMAAAEASAAALSWCSVIFGTLAVVAMFFLGKEAVGTKKAGYVAALFIAFCPVVISQTVFSNGTEIAEVAFLFILFLLFAVKGIKAFAATKVEDKFADVFKANKKAMIYAAVSGIFLALIVLSWNGFRPVMNVMFFTMAALVLVDRFIRKDARVPAMFFSIIILIATIAGVAYSIPFGIWSTVFSGTCYAAVIAVAVCLLFAFLQTKPWIVTVPAFSVVLIVFFAVLAIVKPSLFTIIVSGNSPVTAVFGSMTGTLSISVMATNFGYVTMWFGIVTVAVMVFRFLKNASSPLYVSTLVIMALGTYYATVSTVCSVMFAPIFALGFAFVLMWMFDNVDFKSYFLSFKSADIRTIWKKILKPIPFMSVFAIAILICLPNAFYAVDASIPSNSRSDFSGLDIGASSYYIKTDSDWKINDVLKSYGNVEKDGAMVTWADYAGDVSAYGGFRTIADSSGNGAEAASNILLASGTNGASTAAMLIYLLEYTGFNDNTKTLLTGAGLSDADYEVLKNVVTDPSYKIGGKTVRQTVTGNVSKYGALSTDVSDLNLSYIYGKVFLTEKYTSYEISAMYKAIASDCGKDITYFMVSGNMFPLYYGYSVTFAEMAMVNGYRLTDSYGTVGQFLKTDYFTQYFGIYSYTDAMYDTLLWRAYIGMSPEEAGFSGMLASMNYVNALMFSDGTYKAQPGYGLGNYAVDYDHWYVMYTSKTDSSSVSAGDWQKMLYRDAIQKQETQGGLVNYLSGLPVVMKYVPNSAGVAVSGTVTDSAAAGVAGIRVSVIDADGVVRSTAKTDSNGAYTVFVTDMDHSKIKYYAGSLNFEDGSLITTINANAGAYDVAVGNTSISGKLTDADGKDFDSAFGVIMSITGQVSKKTYDVPVDANMKFDLSNIVPDIYSITVKSADGKVTYYNGSDSSKDKYVTEIGQNKGMIVKLDTAVVSLSVTDKDTTTKLRDGTGVKLTSAENGTIFVGTITDGVAKIVVPVGTYICDVSDDGYVVISEAIQVSSSTSKTVNAVSALKFTVSGLPHGGMAMINSTGYQVSDIISDSGILEIKVPAGTAYNSIYTLLSYEGDEVFSAILDATAASYAVTADHSAYFTVSGIMKNPTGSAVSGTVVFQKEGSGIQFPVHAGSDGSYRAKLPSGTYSIVANSGSQVFIKDAYAVAADAELNIDLVAGQKISISSYWYTSSYYLEYQRFTFSAITDGTTSYTSVFNFITDVSGTVSMYIPQGYSCTVTALLPNTGAINYGAGEFEKVETNVTGSKAFSATYGNVTVENATGYEIEFNGTAIPTATSQGIDITSRIATVRVNYQDGAGGAKYYASMTYYIKPLKDPAAHIVIDNTVLSPKPFYLLTLTCDNQSDIVDIIPIDDGIYNSKDESTAVKTYYLEKDKEFKIQVTNADSTKLYLNKVSIAADTGLAATLSDYATVSGYVGMAKNGTLTVTSAAAGWAIEYSVTSGSYSGVKLPVGSDYNLAAQLEVKSGDKVTHQYAGNLDITSAEIAAGQTYVRNFTVTGGETAPTEELTVTADISEVSAAGTEKETVKLLINVTRNVDTGSDPKTYELLSGSDWTSLTFYSDAGLTVPISTVTLNAGGSAGCSTTVYASGEISKSKVALDSENFSVSLKDMSSDEKGKAKVTDTGAHWNKTDKKETLVNFGTDVAGNSEYKYAITIKNLDNYTKTYTVKTESGIDGAKWFANLAYKDEVVLYDPAVGTNIEVTGYTTLTVYVKVLSKDGTGTPGNIVSTVTPVDGTETVKSDNLNDGISITGNVVKVNSQTFRSMIKVTDSGASGRGVFNDKGSMPTYVWILIAVMVMLFLLVLWMSSKRGVFSRKK